MFRLFISGRATRVPPGVASTRNKMSSKSRSKRKPDQVGIDFCLCIVEVLIACYSCKYILKENKCKEILNPVNVVLATRICKKFR